MLTLRPVRLRSSYKHVRYISERPVRRQRSPGALSPTDQPTETNEDGSRNLRTRKHGNRSLPLPQIMDPSLMGRKTKHKERKKTWTEEGPTEFQKKLAQNPYAQALATPMRQCCITFSRLPTHFLLPFISRIDPPEEDTSDEPKRNKRIMASIVYDTNKYNRDRSKNVSTARSHVFSSQILLNAITTGRRSPWAALVTQRMRQWYADKMTRNVTNIGPKHCWNWQEETSTIVLEHLRSNVVRYFSRAVDERLVSWSTEGQSKKNAACLIPLEGEDNASGELSDGVPVHNLTQLLSDADLGAVTTVCAALDNQPGDSTTLMVEANNRTQALDAAILKLSTYLGVGST